MAIADDLLPPSGWDITLLGLIGRLDALETPFTAKISYVSSGAGDVRLRQPDVSRASYRRHGLLGPQDRGPFCDDDLTTRALSRAEQDLLLAARPWFQRGSADVRHLESETPDCRVVDEDHRRVVELRHPNGHVCRARPGILSPSPRLPTFFILGAGRSGTTSLAGHLRQHPRVFIPEIKEPSFFASSFQWVRDPGKYVDLYSDVGEATQLGDASHIYLEDPKSPQILEAFFPDAKFILMFRNPADRALAMYSLTVEGGYELEPTFEKALAAEDRRFESGRFRKNCPHSFWNFMYFRSGLFGEQVSRYLDRWPRERFYATTMYEYLKEPELVTGEVLEFLELDPVDLGSVPHYGASKGT